MLPDSMLMRDGVDKIILRMIAKNKIPDSVIQREKSGMRVPVHFWFQGRLRRSAKKMLVSRNRNKDSLFNRERIKEIVNYDTGQLRSRHGLKIWMLYNFELWKDRCCV